MCNLSKAKLLRHGEKIKKSTALKTNLWWGKSDAEIFDMLQLPDFAKFFIHEQKKIEGWLYPDTYSYTPNWRIWIY